MCSWRRSQSSSLGTPPEVGNCSLFATVPEKSVRNIAGNKDELGPVGLDALLFLLAHPAEFGEHGCEVVGFGAAKAALILAEKLTPDLHIADACSGDRANTADIIHSGEEGAAVEQIHAVPILREQSFQILAHQPFALIGLQRFPLFALGEGLQSREPDAASRRSPQAPAPPPRSG